LNAAVKVLVLAPFEYAALEKLRSRIGIIYQSWTETDKLLDPQEFIDFSLKEDVTIVVMEADFIFEEVFEGTDKLRFIGVCRGTVNNVDLDSATQHGVLVVNTPGRNSTAVAELTLGLALCLARRIPYAGDYIRGGKWTDPAGAYTGLRGIELGGKTAGIIGLGAIGREVAQRFRAFGMSVIAYDPLISKELFKKLEVAPVDLDTLMKVSDFVTIHCTAGERTAGLVGKKQLDLLKPSAYLINTASWEAVDEQALLSRLQNHAIAGAAFDIFKTHPLAASSPLLKLDNVLLTPHIGGATDLTVKHYSDMICEDIFRFLDGKKPLRLLNPEAWRS